MFEVKDDRMTRRKRILLSVVALLALLIVWIACHLFRIVQYGIPEAYAAWDTGALVVTHLSTHTNQWPRSWEDLFFAASVITNRGKYLRGVGAYGPSVTNLPDIVSVDWSANVDLVAGVAAFDGKNVPFQAISRRNGKRFRTVWSGAEPNEMVWRYLQTQVTGDAGTSNKPSEATR